MDDVTKAVSATDDRSISLWLLSGEFDWDDVRDDLDNVVFDDSEYRNVEVWEEDSRGLTVGLLEDRGLVVISSPEDDGVKDVIRALQSGDGFLFEDVDLEITRVLSRVKVGFQMIAEEGCGEVDLRSCKVVAYSVGRGVDGRKLDLEWVFLFRSESSARSGSRDIEGYFEDEMPSEVEVEDVEQDGEYVVVTASIDEEDLSLYSRITVVNVRPRPTADVIFPTFTPTAITPTSIAPSTIPTAAGMVQVGTLVEGDIGSSGEVDEYQVTLDGGSTYIIETVLDTLNDSELYIFDVDGQTELDYNDDFLNRESRVEFTAPRSGVYHIRVNGFDTSVGGYQLSITEDVLATATASNGAKEAMDTEYQTIQSAVFAMMSDNALSSLPNPVNIAGGVQNMAAFPDGTSVAGSADKLTDPNGNPYRAGDLAGYTLFGHDIAGDGAAIGLVNYVAPGTTTYFYVIARDGSIGQYDSTGVLTNGIVVPTVLVPAFPAPLPIGNMVLVGMSVEGDIRSSGEVDEYGVLLEGGSTYIIKTELGTLPDSVLYMLDIDGQTQLGFNDDFLDRESRIDFTAPRTGVYFVQVNGFSVSVGSYALSITEDFSVVIPTAVPTAVAVEVEVPVTVEVPVIQTVEAVVTPTPVILVEKSQVTVVFGGSPENLGVYGAPGCAIIPQHFPCQDAATDVLTYIDSTTFEVVPLSGVQSWEQIEIDRWRFELTPGVKFHNGEEWNAAAAKAGIDWQSDISNGQASVFYTGTAVGEVIDDLTVDVVCDDPCPIFPKTGFLIGFQAPEWVANASELDKVSTTIGFGPYEITEWDLGIDVTMEKYDDYVPNANAPNDASAPTIDVIKMVWRDEPLVRAAMVQVGEVDWAFDLGLDQVDQVPVFDHGGAAETFVNVFDTIWHPELSKTQVRQALAYATDCQTIVDELYDGFYECQGTYAPPGTLGVTARTLAPYPFDPDLAVELLKEANYDPTNEIVINVFAGRFFRNVEVAEAQAQMWRDVGVTVSVENPETAKWLDVARTGCGRAIEEFANLDNPPEDFCLSLDPGPPSFASPNTYQLNPSLETLDFARALNRMDCLDLTAKFCDPVNVQPLIEPARAAVGDDRLAKMTELAGISYDEAIIYTYFNAEVFYGVSKDLIWEPRYDRRLRVNQWRFR